VLLRVISFFDSLFDAFELVLVATGVLDELHSTARALIGEDD